MKLSIAHVFLDEARDRPRPFGKIVTGDEISEKFPDAARMMQGYLSDPGGRGVKFAVSNDGQTVVMGYMAQRRPGQKEPFFMGWFSEDKYSMKNLDHHLNDDETHLTQDQEWRAEQLIKLLSSHLDEARARPGGRSITRESTFDELRRVMPDVARGFEKTLDSSGLTGDDRGKPVSDPSNWKFYPLDEEEDGIQAEWNGSTDVRVRIAMWTWSNREWQFECPECGSIGDQQPSLECYVCGREGEEQGLDEVRARPPRRATRTLQGVVVEKLYWMLAEVAGSDDREIMRLFDDLGGQTFVEKVIGAGHRGGLPTLTLSGAETDALEELVDEVYRTLPDDYTEELDLIAKALSGPVDETHLRPLLTNVFEVRARPKDGPKGQFDWEQMQKYFPKQASLFIEYLKTQEAREFFYSWSATSSDAGNPTRYDFESGARGDNIAASIIIDSGDVLWLYWQDGHWEIPESEADMWAGAD